MISPERIDISIIIAAYNQWKYTKACLNSVLHAHSEGIQYELILADDCSTDETTTAALIYPGLKVIRTNKNVGFIKNCNHAAQFARGQYIVLLNNDTLVLPNWLTSLYQTLESDETIAIAGSKMLYHTGRIQEAGSVLFRDGTASQIGKGYPRDTPLFSWQRETDYVSGCSLMVRASFWKQVAGFDEQYHHAYYEDTDLAMRARALGMRVVYQPLSEVIHFEHKTYASIWRKYLSANRKIFLKKWSTELLQHCPRYVSWPFAMSHAIRTPSKATQQRRQNKRFNILYYFYINI